MKFIARTIILLLLINGFLLYVHYNDAGNVKAQEEVKTYYTQEIEVTNRIDALYIRHHFRGLSDKQLDINWSTDSTERGCVSRDADSCERFNEGATAFVANENQQQTITYKIPKTTDMQNEMLFNNIFATLQGSIAQSTILHITDEVGIGGMWVNGLRKVGTESRELITYSLYRGAGGVEDLYWQKNDLALLYNGERIAVYGEQGDLEKFKETDAQLQNVSSTHSTVVFSDTSTPMTSSRFIIANENEIKGAMDRLVTNSISMKYSFTETDHLLKEVVSSILSGQMMGTSIAQAIYTEWNDTLNEEEHTDFISLLRKMSGKTLDAEDLDGIVSQVTGHDTSFFTRNITEQRSTYPFLLEDERSVTLNGEEQTDTHVILKDGKAFYSTTEILTPLGFTVTTNEQSIYIESADRKYRFPKRELFYVLNDRRYKVNTTPFEEIDGTFYFEENAFKRLFLLSIDKTDENIAIIPISSLIKEYGK